MNFMKKLYEQPYLSLLVNFERVKRITALIWHFKAENFLGHFIDLKV